MLVFRYLERGNSRDLFNLGSEQGTSVLEVIGSGRRITGKDFKVMMASRRPGDPAVLVGSSRKAKMVLGWKPEYPDIDTIVAHTWKWHEHAEY